MPADCPSPVGAVGFFIDGWNTRPSVFVLQIMRTVQPIEDPQSVTFKIRNIASEYVFTLEEKQSGVRHSITPDDVLYADDGLTITFAFPFVGRRFYVLQTATVGGILLNRTILYSTSQLPLQPYRPLDDFFITPDKQKITFKPKPDTNG